MSVFPALLKCHDFLAIFQKETLRVLFSGLSSDTGTTSMEYRMCRGNVRAILRLPEIMALPLDECWLHGKQPGTKQ